MTKPILFNTEMVRAILEGRKTVTRRVVRLKYSNTHLEMRTDKYGTRLIELQNEEPGVTTVRNPDGTTTHKLLAAEDKVPPYQRNDILWVRETWTKEGQKYFYRADFDSDYLDPCETLSGGYPSYCVYHPGCDGCMRERQRIRWRPSIHMPKEAARLFLRVTGVRVERLQNITASEAETEGVGSLFTDACAYDDKYEDIPWNPSEGLPVHQFARLWDSTLKPADRSLYGWEANPWVWVIQFERCEKPEGF